MATALSKALKGEPLSETQTKGALKDAVTKISNLGKKADKWKDNAMDAGSEVVQTIETQGSLFMSALAEGYWGKEKLSVAKVDTRGAVGGGLILLGTIDVLNGGKYGGSHMVAVGNGLVGAALASAGVSAGKTLRANKDMPTPRDATGGAERTITLTPEPSTAGESRFVRAHAA